MAIAAPGTPGDRRIESPGVSPHLKLQPRGIARRGTAYMKTPPFPRTSQSDWNAEQYELFRTKTNGRKAYRLTVGL